MKKIIILLLASCFVCKAQNEKIRINKQEIEVDTSLNFELKGYWECFYVEEWGSVKVNNEEFLSAVDNVLTPKLNNTLKGKLIYTYFDETKILTNLAWYLLPFTPYKIIKKISSNVDSTKGSFYPVKGRYISVDLSSSVIDSDLMLEEINVINKDIITIDYDSKIFYLKRKKIDRERLEYITDNRISYCSSGTHYLRPEAKYIKLQYSIFPKDSIKLSLIVIPQHSNSVRDLYNQDIPHNNDHITLLKLPNSAGKILEYNSRNYHKYGEVKVEINVDYDVNIKEIKTSKADIYSNPKIKTKMYLLKEDLVEVLEESGTPPEADWLKIRYYGKKVIEGWIKRSDVE